MEDHPYYLKSNRLCVTDRQGKILHELPCERVFLPGPERWPSHHIGAHIGRSGDETVTILVSGGDVARLYRADNRGRIRDERDSGLPGAGGFAVLPEDGIYLAITGGGAHPVRVHESADEGHTWQVRADIPLAPFDAMHVDSANLLVLRDGSLRLGLLHYFSPPQGAPLSANTAMQYIYRSDDGGHTWTCGIDRKLWTRFKADDLTVADRALLQHQGFDLQYEQDALLAVDNSPTASWPGDGGTYPGCYETGLTELSSGRLMAAFRISGFPRPWHHEVAEDWGAGPPDSHGRIFRHVMLGHSDDGGLSLSPPRPVVDNEGHPLLLYGECNGELVELPDGRLVLVHQTRYPRGRSQLSAKVSMDGGLTWHPETWRINYGFGYSSTLALADNQLLTVTGSSLGDNGHPRRVMAISWRID